MAKNIELAYVDDIFPTSAADRAWLAAHMGIQHINVFLPSTSILRRKHVQQVVAEYGIPTTPKTVNGPTPEVGATTADVALHKAMFVVDILRRDGHLERNQDKLSVVIAIDSRNDFVQPGRGHHLRDKPVSLAQFEEFYAEWDMVAMGDARLFDHSAYALIAIRGGQIFSSVLEDIVELHPMDRNAVHFAFRPLEHRYPINRTNAHGFSTAEFIADHLLFVTDVQGREIMGQSAVDRVYGASEPMIASLLDSALSAFIR